MKQIAAGRKTKAEIAAERLEAAIVSCELAPGAVFVEAEIAEMLDLGRTPVREALVKLSNENLVKLGRGGVVIPELNVGTMLKLLELRAPLERLCIQKAIQRQNDNDKKRFAEIVAALEPLPCDNRTEFMALLRQIHIALAEASKNEFILSSLKTTQGLSRRFWCYFATDEDQKFCTELYCKMLKAFAADIGTTPIAESEKLMAYLRDFTSQTVDNLIR